MRNGFFLLIAMSVLISACNMSAEIGNLNETVAPLPTVSLEKVGGAAIVSGANVKVTATGGYKVSSSVGNYPSEIKVESTDGYKVFMNYDGQIHAEF